MGYTFRNATSCCQPLLPTVEQLQYGSQGARYIIQTPRVDVSTDPKLCGCGATDSSSSLEPRVQKFLAVYRIKAWSMQTGGGAFH